MNKAAFFLAVIVPMMALSMSLERRARDRLAKFGSEDATTAEARRRAVEAALSDAGHRRVRDNLPYALVIALIAIPIILLIDYLD